MAKSDLVKEIDRKEGSKGTVSSRSGFAQIAHNRIKNRSVANAHPISAITGLNEALTSIPKRFVSQADTPNTLQGFEGQLITSVYNATDGYSKLAFAGDKLIIGTEGRLNIKEDTGDPGPPNAGYVKLYAKEDGLYYQQDDSTVTGPLGAGSSGGPPFSDDTFQVEDDADDTKKLAFDVGTNVPTATVVTLQVPDTGGIIAITDDIISDHTALSNIGTNTHAQIDAHIADTNNPHSLTLGQLGGTLDHGGLDGLSDDDHTQYLLATGLRPGASSTKQTFTLGAALMDDSYVNGFFSVGATTANPTGASTNALTIVDDTLPIVVLSSAVATPGDNVGIAYVKAHADGQDTNHKGIASLTMTTSGTTAGQRGGAIWFQTKQDGGVSNDYAVLKEGYFGIGISPTYKLDVDSADAIVGRFQGRVIGENAVNTNEFVTKQQLDTAVSGTGVWTKTGNNLHPATAGNDVYLGTDEKLGVNVDPSTITGGIASFNGNVGFGTTFADTNVHIKDGSSGGGDFGDAQLGIESATDAFIDLLTPTTRKSGIYFSDPSYQQRGGIYFDHDWRRLHITTWNAGLNIPFNAMDITDYGFVRFNHSGTSLGQVDIQAVDDSVNALTLYGASDNDVGLKHDIMRIYTKPATGTIGTKFSYDALLNIKEYASKPANPSSGYWKLYGKSDGLYVLEDNGTEHGPLGAGTVGGSGTLFTLPLWTPDGSTLGDSVLKQQSGNIGLGMTPMYALDVTSGAAVAARFDGSVIGDDATADTHFVTKGQVYTKGETTSAFLLKDGSPAAGVNIGALTYKQAFQQGIGTDEIIEYTTGNGVTIDGVLIKDGSIPSSVVLEHAIADAPSNGTKYVRQNATWVAESASSGVGGSGTTSKIPKWTPDGNTLGDSVLLESSGKVGLNMTPTYALDVNSGVAVAARFDGSVIADPATADTHLVTKGQVYTTSEAETNFVLSDGTLSAGLADASKLNPTWFLNGVRSNTIGEYTSGAGVTIDSVLMKDGSVQIPTNAQIQLGSGASDPYFSSDANAFYLSAPNKNLVFGSDSGTIQFTGGSDITLYAEDGEIILQSDDGTTPVTNKLVIRETGFYFINGTTTIGWLDTSGQLWLKELTIGQL